MATIDKHRLDAKLATIPEDRREAYLGALKAKGYTWEEMSVAQEPSLARRLLNTIPTSGGAAIGAALGAPAGPLGMAAGAALGGAGGRAWQRVGEWASGARDPAMQDTSSDVARDVGLAGLGEGATQAGMSAGLGALKYVSPRVMPGLAKALAGIREKHGEMIYGSVARSGKTIPGDPDILRRAALPQEIGELYEGFEKMTGLAGLQKFTDRAGRLELPPASLERMVVKGAKLAKKVPPSPYSQAAGAETWAGTPGQAGAQLALPMPTSAAGPPPTRAVLGRLYRASQAANKLKQITRYENPEAAHLAASASLKEKSAAINAALEGWEPLYRSLRRGYAESKAKEAFSYVLPRNKGGTTNVLRPALAIRDVLTGAARGALGLSLAGLPAISPAAWGLTTRAVTSPAARFLGRWGARGAAAEATRKEELP